MPHNLSTRLYRPHQYNDKRIVQPVTH